MNQVPPCCASCTEHDQVCRLLARPTLESRARLLSMPCDVPRLVRLRFRGHGEEIARRALDSWVSPAHDASTLAWSFGEQPRDARIWATAWPVRELVRAEVRDALSAARSPSTPPPSGGASADPVRFARIAAALARVSQLDPAGFAMLVEALAGRFDVARWRDALGARDEEISERLLLGVYRYAAIFFDAVERVSDGAARAALVARRFSPGDPGEAASLAAFREALGRRELGTPELRAAYATGARASIALLADERAFGGLLGARAERAFAKTLGLDDGATDAGDDTDVDGVAEDFLAELASHARAGGTAGAEDHIDTDRLAALASGTLDAPNVGPLARHLFLCADGRCNTFLRWETGGREAARRHLAGPLAEPATSTGPVALTRGSPRVVYCREVLWEAFTRMAAAEGRSVDELVEDAMARYQAVRESFAALDVKPVAPPARGRSSIPPPLSRRAPSVPPIPSLVPPPTDDLEITTDALDDPARAPLLEGAATDASARSTALSTVPAPQDWEPELPPPSGLGPPDLRSAEDIAEATESLASHEADERDSTAPKAPEKKPQLVAEYAGRRYPIASARFVIGRERTTCHLVLPDPNVSRQHATVEWANGAYFLVDQGSLNGVGCSGHRIHRKQIVDGDCFDISGHKIRFTYRAS